MSAGSSHRDDASSSARQPTPGRGVLGVLAAALVVLTIVFGVAVSRHNAAFTRYRDTTIIGPDARLPWQLHPLEVSECVSFAVDWGLECPGLQTWCANETPVVVRRCLESSERVAYCTGVGDAGASTRFGVAECEAMRASVEGRYRKRSHKKFCAAGYRAVAEYCREIVPASTS